MKNLCIIPARGGSKRIPRKNIKDFLGKPIIAYAIQNAIDSNLFDEIMVSTDDFEIKSIAETFGASVPFLRTETTSSDFATTADVIKEVLNNYLDLGFNFENVCCLYPCTPLIQAEHLKEAFNKLNLFESIFPVVPFSVPIQRAMKIEDGFLKWINPENAQKRTQDLKTSYHDAGQFYFLKVNSFLNTNKILTEHTSTIVLNEMDVQDIDNESDWKLAELKFEMRK